MKKTVYLGFSLLLIMALAIPSLAQSQLEADNAYRAFYNETNAQKKTELGEKFLAAFKDSQYRAPVFQTLVNNYVQGQNWAKVLDAAERLTQVLPSADNRLKVFAYTRGMLAANQMNNADKTIEFGDKVLAVDPNDLNALLTVYTTILGRLPQDAAAKEAALKKSFDYAKKAGAQPKPQGVPDDQWQDVQNQIHSNIGFIYLNTREWDKATGELLPLTKSTPKDAAVQYRLGLAYQGLAAAAQRQVLEAYNAENAAITAKAEKVVIDELVAKRDAIDADYKEKRDKAIDSFAKAVAIGGEVAPQARVPLENLYKAKNNDSLDGLDALISQKKAELGV